MIELLVWSAAAVALGGLFLIVVSALLDMLIGPQRITYDPWDDEEEESTDGR